MDNGKTLTIYFAQQYLAKYGHQYPVAWTKDPAIMKRLLGMYSGAMLKKAIVYYLNEFKNPFVEKTGHKLEVFVSSLPEVLASMDRQVKPNVNPDFDRLEQARRENPEGSTHRQGLEEVAGVLRKTPSGDPDRH